MAAFSTLAVSANEPGTVTLTFNAAAVVCTSYQLKQLKAVVDKCVVQCTAAEGQSASSAAITLPTGF
jgi:hypothetical protein